MNGINEALSLLPERMESPEARVMLYVIALQESRFKHRRQLVGSPPRPTGPATGFWQFERGGGVRGVLNHRATADLAAGLCMVQGVKPDSQSAWAALEHDDVLAAGFARLLLWTDPHALPAIGDHEAAYRLYIRTWRPGKPKPDTWFELYHQALREVELCPGPC